MTITAFRRCSFPVALLFLTGLLGCGFVSTSTAGKAQGTKQKKEIDKDLAEDLKPKEGKRAKIGKNVYLEVFPGDKRRVLIKAEVCRREGELEQLMCLKETKEHEAVLTADCDARRIHQALILAKAKAGSPVRFGEKFQPANGTAIRVLVQYEKKGKTVIAPAAKWIRHFQTKKELNSNWVFAGSKFIKSIDPNIPDRYAANDGDVICVSNFESALLDLPVKSSKDAGNLLWQANTSEIPAERTPVTIILQPLLEKKK